LEISAFPLPSFRELLTRSETTIANNPFLNQPGIDLDKLHVLSV